MFNDHNNYNQSAPVASGFMSRVFGWMFAGLSITTGVSYYFSHDVNPHLFAKIANGPLWVLFLVQLGLVWYFASNWQKVSYGNGALLFMTYSALNGLTLTPILYIYTRASLMQTFLVTALMFGTMALYGAVTRFDLSGVGNIAFMGLVGIIIASIVNMFMHSSQLSFMISCIGVLVFTVLTAYDVQKLRAISRQMGDSGAHPDMMSKLSLMGALTLYLDVLNLFLFLLQLLGERRR